MKRKLLQNSLVALFLSVLFLGMTSQVSAQATEDILLITTYSNDSEMDAIFENSKRVLVYTEGGNEDPAKVISISTLAQKDVLVKMGMQIEIAARDPDLERYVLLYNPKEDQSNVLEEYGKPIIVSRYYTLLELEKGKELVFEGPIAKFFTIPFLDEVVRPPKGTPVQPRISQAPVDQKSGSREAANKKMIFIMSLFFLITLILIGVIIFIIKKRKSQNTQNF